jgi:RNA polymerase sigma-70 factor (ECF subfamily)
MIWDMTARPNSRPERPGLGEQFDQVLAAAQAGAPWALERLWVVLAPAVAGYLRVQGAGEPDDVTSDTFVAVFGGLRSFRGSEAGFRSWVFTIAHHRLVDERRRRARRPDPVHEQAEAVAERRPGGDVEAEALRALSTERVRRLCDRLSPDQRDVLLLRMVAGLTLEETAATLDKPAGAVKALQHRAVQSLRRQLGAGRDRKELAEGVSP